MGQRGIDLSKWGEEIEGKWAFEGGQKGLSRRKIFLVRFQSTSMGLYIHVAQIIEWKCGMVAKMWQSVDKKLMWQS